MINKKQFLALMILGLSFGWLFLVNQPTAQATPCDSPTADWNKDYFNPGKTLVPSFRCGCVSMSSWTDPTFPTTIVMSSKADSCTDCGTCPSGEQCKCIREADCAKATGGQCYKTGEAPTGTTKVPWRCPGDSEYTCWVKNVGNTTPILPKGQGDSLPPAVSVSDCCRQIVPDLGDPLKNEYSLNQLVQVAINIYECILCVVGALILLMLVAGAFILMTSAGNDSMVGKGKQIISAAIIGGIIVFFSYLIINFTVKALGAKFNNENRVEINPQG